MALFCAFLPPLVVNAVPFMCTCEWGNPPDGCTKNKVVYYVNDEMSGCCYQNKLPSPFTVTKLVKLCGSNNWTQALYIDKTMIDTYCNMDCTARKSHNQQL